jgi:PBSX family phage terminase large subunit
MLGGGRGSTKSSFASSEIITGMMSDPKANCVAMRKIGLNLKDSVYEQLLWAIEALKVSHLWTAKLSPLELIYNPTGQKILFRGADNPKKIKSTKFRHGYCKYIWYEELDEFTGMEEVRTINQSLMRGGDFFYVFYTYNPPKSARNWVNDEVLKQNDDRLVHHSTYETVPKAWLGEQFFIEAEHLKATNERAYRHEYLGEVTGTGGAVFENVRLREITQNEIHLFDHIYNGVDWGYFPDPWAFNRMHYDAARRILYIFEELTRIKMGNRQTAEELIKKGMTIEDKITADSAEPKSVADYKSYGLWCRGAIKGPGSVEYSMKWMQALTAIVIDPERCPDTAKEFMHYEYERDKDGTPVQGYPDKDNHHIDAVRYAMEEVWKRRGA